MSPRRVAVLFFVGTILLQAAWILAVPPYRGSDEFDHAYRAASVAHGYWHPEIVPAEDGRGALIPVPRTLVTDATPVCSNYGYTGPDNCNPVDELGDGLVTVASAAALYNPLFYAAIGWPTVFLDGAASLYAMRVTASLICAGLLAMAAGSVAGWARTRWPLVGLCLSITPVVVYSSVVPAPNGVEILSAVCVWAGLVGLARASTEARQRNAIVTAAVGAALLVNVRTLGPIWLALIVLTCLLALGTGRSLAPSAVRHRGLGLLAGGSVCAATLLGVGWSAGTRQLTALEPSDVPDVSPWGPAFGEIPRWILQSIGAFPLRDERAPTIVYVGWTLLFIALLGAGCWRSGKRLRLGILACGIVSLVFPLTVTVATVTTAGTFWQGRYTLPYAVGLTILAGAALDDLRLDRRLLSPLIIAGSAGFAMAQLVSPTSVLVKQLVSSPLAGDPRWWTAPLWVVSALAAAGSVVWLYAALFRPPQREPSAEPVGRITPPASVARSAS
jgi:hypothetical protein